MIALCTSSYDLAHRTNLGCKLWSFQCQLAPRIRMSRNNEILENFLLIGFEKRVVDMDAAEAAILEQAKSVPWSRHQLT